MKSLKLYLSLLLLLTVSNTLAVDLSPVYFSIQAGPKISFTQNIYFPSTISSFGGSLKGIGIGYNNDKSNFSIESGLYHNIFETVLDFSQPLIPRTYDKLKFKYSGWQVPVHFSSHVFLNKKRSVYLSPGVGLSYITEMLQSNIKFQDGFVIGAVMTSKEEGHNIVYTQFNYAHKNTTLLIEASLGLNFQINQHFEFAFKPTYQTAFVSLHEIHSSASVEGTGHINYIQLSNGQSIVLLSAVRFYPFRKKVNI